MDATAGEEQEVSSGEEPEGNAAASSSSSSGPSLSVPTATPKDAGLSLTPAAASADEAVGGLQPQPGLAGGEDLPKVLESLGLVQRKHWCFYHSKTDKPVGC